MIDNSAIWKTRAVRFSLLDRACRAAHSPNIDFSLSGYSPVLQQLKSFKNVHNMLFLTILWMFCYNIWYKCPSWLNKLDNLAWNKNFDPGGMEGWVENPQKALSQPVNVMETRFLVLPWHFLGPGIQWSYRLLKSLPSSFPFPVSHVEKGEKVE
jgi:hypothetical protein